MVDTNLIFNFTTSKKVIKNQEQNSVFINGQTYKNIVSFIELLQSKIWGIKNTLCYKDIEQVHNLVAFYSFLEKAEELVEKNPPIDKEKQRFGNTAFRTWYSDLEKLFDNEFGVYLNDYNTKNKVGNGNLSDEVKPYFMECFGNSSRIDFGTGHELNFIMSILIFACVGFIQEQDLQKAVQVVYKKYLTLVRKLQTVYNLEPAGSKGVYGLDDYFFLAFILGAAELVGVENILPSDMKRDLKALDEYSKDYSFFEAVHFNLKAKNGNMAEHSPVLYQISEVPKWEKIAKGLIKMFEDEVMKKLVVSQHFYFGDVIRFE